MRYIRFSLTVKKGRQGLENAKIQFYQKGEPTAMITSYKKGRSSYKLNINSEYVIRISYPGQSSRTISFNTEIPDENLLDVWPSYSFNAELLDGITTEQQLSRPFVRIKYDPDLYDFEPGEFRWDKLEKAEEVKTLLTDVVKEYREEEELLALEEQQNEVANKLAQERAATEELEQSVIDEQKALDEAQLNREKELKESLEKESIALKNEFSSKLSDITRAESRIMASKGEISKINNSIRTKEAKVSRLQGEEKLEEQLELNELKKKLISKQEQIKKKEIAALELKNEASKIESELLTVNKQLNKPSQSPSIDISNHAAAISKLRDEIKELKTAKGLNDVEGLNIKESIELAEKSLEEDKRLENTKAQNVINEKENEINELTEELSFLEKRGSEKNNKINEYKRKAKDLEREYKRMNDEDDPSYAYRYHEADIKRLGAERDYTNNLIFRLNKEQDLLFAENEKLLLFKNLSDDKESINESIEKNNSRLKDIEEQINKSEKQLEDYDKQINEKNELVDKSLAMVRAYKKQNKDKELEAQQARLLEEQEKANKLKNEAEKLKREQAEKQQEFKAELADISLEQTKINNHIINLKDEKEKFINQQIPIDDNINDLNKELKTKSGLDYLQLKAKLIRKELKSLSLGSEISRLNQKISDQEQRLTDSKINQAEISIEFSTENNEINYLKENISKLKIKYSELKKSENKYSDRRTTIKKDIKAKQAQLNDLNDQIAQRIEEEKQTLASMEKEEAERKRKELEAQRLNEENAKRQSYLEDASRITSLNNRLKKEIELLKKNETLISDKVDKYNIDIQRVRNEQLDATGSQKQSKKLDELLYQYRSHQQKIKLNGIKYKLRIKEIELERNISDLKLVEAELEPKNTDLKIKESNRHIDNAEDMERSLTEFSSKQTRLKGELANLKSAYENERSKFNSSVALAEKSANESKEAVEQSGASESTINSSNDLAQSRQLLLTEKESYKNRLKEIKTRIYELETNETRSLNKDKSYKEKLRSANQNISLLSGLKKKYKEVESLQLELKLLRSQKTTEKIQALLLAKQLEENKLERKIKLIDEKINSPNSNIIETDVCADLLAKKKRLDLKLDESKADYNDIKRQIAKKEIELDTKQKSIEEDELALRDEEERRKNQKTLSLEASLSVIVNDESEIQEQIKAQKALQTKANQKKSKLKTVNGQLKDQRQNLSGGQLVIKDYEISRNELASLKNEYNKYKAELEEYKSYKTLSEKRKERIQAEKNLKKLKPYTTISSLISNPSSTTISTEITRIQGLIADLESNLKIKNDETVIKGLKAKKATEEAKLQAKIKLDKLKKEREEKERRELAAKKEAERIRAQNRAKQEAKMKAQAAVAARPLELKTNTYQEGQYKVQKTVVLSRKQDDIYVKKTDSTGRTIYRKNDRPITASTYELELRRLRQQLDEYNE